MRAFILSLICLCSWMTVYADAGDVAELQRLRSLTDEQLREELEQRGLTPDQAKAGAKHLRRQLGPRVAEPRELPERQFLKLPEQARGDVLDKVDPIESQFIHVYTDERDVTRFTLTNNTTLPYVIHRPDGFEFHNHPADFTVYGVTADGRLFKTVLPTAAAGKLPNGHNVRAFAVERKHLPVTLFFHEIASEEQGKREQPATPRSPEADEAAAPLLLPFLEQEAKLILKFTGEPKASPATLEVPQRTAAPWFVISWERNHGYMFSLATTQQPVIGKTFQW